MDGSLPIVLFVKLNVNVAVRTACWSMVDLVIVPSFAMMVGSLLVHEIVVHLPEAGSVRFFSVSSGSVV